MDVRLFVHDRVNRYSNCVVVLFAHVSFYVPITVDEAYTVVVFSLARFLDVRVAFVGVYHRVVGRGLGVFFLRNSNFGRRSEEGDAFGCPFVLFVVMFVRFFICSNFQFVSRCRRVIGLRANDRPVEDPFVGRDGVGVLANGFVRFRASYPHRETVTFGQFLEGERVVYCVFPFHVLVNGATQVALGDEKRVRLWDVPLVVSSASIGERCVSRFYLRFQ